MGQHMGQQLIWFALLVVAHVLLLQPSIKMADGYNPPKDSEHQHTVAVLRGGLSTVPVVGGLLAELLGDVPPPSKL